MAFGVAEALHITLGVHSRCLIPATPCLLPPPFNKAVL